MIDRRTIFGRRFRQIVLVLVLVAIAPFLALKILRFAADALLGQMFPAQIREVVEDPGGDFTRRTGIKWPTTATVTSVGDDHGGFHGDGEFHIVFDLDPAIIEEWLANRPPWGQPNWKSGPVPYEIGSHCGFGASTVGGEVIGGVTRYAGYENQPLRNILESSEIRYAAAERCCASLHWHNGSLLMIDPVRNRVWLSVWDF